MRYIPQIQVVCAKGIESSEFIRFCEPDTPKQ